MGKVRKAVDDMFEALDRKRKGIAIKLFSVVIKDTPVDTGRLCANWQTSIGSPESKILEMKDHSGSIAISEAESVINGSSMHDAVFMRNNLPYAKRIEFEGHSGRAPQGMMRRNFERIVALVREKGGVGEG